MICKMILQVEDYKNVPLSIQNAVKRLQFKDEIEEPSNFFYNEEIIADLNETLEIVNSFGKGYKITIESFKQNVFVGLHEKLEAAYPDDISKPIPPNVTHVHIPNIGLLLIDEVQHLDDVCTDTLQRELDQGWRILAVCPPNGTRRPDYILGRTKEK
jgi:hypothetical protein